MSFLISKARPEGGPSPHPPRGFFYLPEDEGGERKPQDRGFYDQMITLVGIMELL